MKEIPIYVAGGFLEKELIAGYMRRLEETGFFKITCDWTKSESSSPGKTSDAQLTDTEQRAFAHADLAGVEAASVVWHIVARKAMTQEIDAIPSEEEPPKKTASSPRCVGCGGWHGGVGAGILCLEARVRQLEAENRALKIR